MESLAVGLGNSRDCRSLLGNQSTTYSDISVFRGALTMEQTRFNGSVQFGNTFFLQPVDARDAIFVQPSNWVEARFSRSVSFVNANFRKYSQFSSSIFFDKADFKQAQFLDNVDFQRSYFAENTNFDRAVFQLLAKFSRVQWQGSVNFSNARFANQAQFTKANFNQLLSLTETTFEQAVTFRETQFYQPVNLRGASILNQADFSDAKFAENSYLNVASLGFNSNQAKILGNPGEIGKKLSVPTLQGNQNVLRNLGQNFRQQQQISDMNWLEYTKQKLRLVELSQRLFAVNINMASEERLKSMGFSVIQAAAIAQHRIQNLFRKPSDLLILPEIDLETYQKLIDKIAFDKPISVVGWLILAWSWLILSLLLLLSGYGTNFWLVVGSGLITIAYFGLIYWFVDRFRRLHPVAIIPKCEEAIWMLSIFILLLLFGLLAIFRNSEKPWLTLLCTILINIPLTLILLLQLYQQGRYHDLMDVSYFTLEGTMRQVRLLIGRLPVIPMYPGFRERYMPLLLDKRWNWLNYYDFSLNNLIRLGFNDIRLRDEHLPGIISTLAWYQWSLGILYITLLLWTLSRTIPGLNLLIYLK